LHRTFARERNVFVIEGDVRDEETAPDAVAATVRRYGRLDGIVCNAGIMVRKPLQRLTLSEWRRVLDTNLTAAFLFARAAEKPLRKARGAIVTIASTRALSEPNTESYSASKGGLSALTHALVVSLAPRCGSKPRITPRCGEKIINSTRPAASAGRRSGAGRLAVGSDWASACLR
jgi:NAD(P)-dependent dehydrogenase (short-subunit alcohol dehydrogenase family)